MIEKTNPYSKNEEKEFETEFFEVVTETITLALQNLIYFEKIRDSAYIDGLTQIYNRKYMDIFLPKKTKAYVHNNINFAIVMFDIDYFKKFNDTYGHQFGDLVLRELSKIVSKNIREIDVLFRYGGEEFVIFMPNITKETVFNRIDNMRKRVADLIIVDEKGMSAQVTCSFGISVFPSASNDGNIKKLINEADTALYFSKESGRNKVTLYGEELKLCN